MTTEEVREKAANLEKCLEDSDLLGQFKQFLDNNRKAAYGECQGSCHLMMLRRFR
jgi:hypothetical protein